VNIILFIVFLPFVASFFLVGVALLVAILVEGFGLGNPHPKEANK